MIKPLIHSMAVCPDMNKQYAKIQYGKGVYLYDEQGRRYLDGSSGSSAVSNLGHGRQEIADVICQQVSKIAVLPTHAFNSDIVENYLQRLVDFAPKGFVKSWTVMSGTEAVENAVKLALQYHQVRGENSRYKIISRWNTYHGNSVFMLDIGGMKARRQLYTKWLNNFPHISPAYNYRRPSQFSEQEYVQSLLQEFEATILETGPETVAAFIAEPVIAAAMGAVPPPKNYFRGMYEICQKYGILFISDEILSGFGRTGENFGINNYGVTPDIIAAGKGISGGYYPLSAVIASEKVIQPLEDSKTAFLGGHTFSCNPVGAAVGTVVLDIIEKEQLVRRSKDMGALFLKKLEVLRQYDMVGDIRGVGLQCGIELVQDKVTKSPFPPELGISKKIGEKSIQKGVVLYPGKGSVDGVAGDHILITPPLTINEEQLDEIVHAIKECIEEVTIELKKETVLR
ncbi:aminotransferase class III-fold pyridoxal phosphate-dependent enzyme [uncultured Dokdonia sp.]|uniref:aminotransferase family protein n=1 Tax=uncultured Dokdonia sp. TaxID=575653 RepID=UPI00261E2BE4|nr:aminotransferase class III-fold pyridoxal phosphate-dependent enzyme [uncultured Dokdonia sp.]